MMKFMMKNWNNNGGTRTLGNSYMEHTQQKDTH